jgi:hypothetical protein
MSLSQKEAVFAAIASVFSQSGKTVGDEKVELSKDERASVIQIVTAGIAAGTVAFSDEAAGKYDSEDKIKGYVGGMVGNWLTKDKRLNGGNKYQAKNPGARAGQGDEVMRNLRALRSQLTDTDHLSAVDEKIAERTAELSAAKVKKVEVDFSKIPADLLATLNLGQ